MLRCYQWSVLSYPIDNILLSYCNSFSYPTTPWQINHEPVFALPLYFLYLLTLMVKQSNKIDKQLTSCSDHQLHVLWCEEGMRVTYYAARSKRPITRQNLRRLCAPCEPVRTVRVWVPHYSLMIRKQKYRHTSIFTNRIDASVGNNAARKVPWTCVVAYRNICLVQNIKQFLNATKLNKIKWNG